MRFYDAHNHLQDPRLGPDTAGIVGIAAKEGVECMVVNGSCEEDWPQVLELARRFPQAIPSIGYHPWYVKERTANWQTTMLTALDAGPVAVGEIGLDRWIENYDLPDQETVFTWQLRVAAERDLPASVHCLQAWGRMLELFTHTPRPRCGFVLHSYGGPAEMIPALAKLGAYFSLPGYFAHERKARQRETFRHVPADRLLIETDAPDQLLPPERIRHPLNNPADGKPVNHPANLKSVYEFVSGLLDEPLPQLAARVEENFLRLFGRLVQRS